MGYRTFRDSHGIEWQTWDVVPRLGERRMGERRLRTIQTIKTERRTRTERRVVEGHRPLLSAGMDGGWLCFEARDEKRRLTPIPADWQVCETQRLEVYCARATRARRVSGSVTSEHRAD